jgi:FdhE protein
LGTPDPLAPGVAEAVAELNALTRTRPSLRIPAAVLADLLREFPAQALPNLNVGLEAATATAKLEDGIPLLRGVAVEFDRHALRRRWQAVCETVGRHHADGAPAALARAAGMEPADLLGEVLTGHPESVAARAEAAGVDAALAGTVLRFACLPLLTRIADQWGPVWREAAWARGYCPVCGSWPLLGEFRGLEQHRVMRCGLCAAGWAFPRLGCPFCGNRDQRRLAYFHAEGEPDRYRASTCDGCRGYVKMVAALAELPMARLLVADLATLHLDLAAAHRGFFVP